jgi:hypothetical protein
MSVDLDALIRLSDGREVAVAILDLSSKGCRVSTRQMIPVGDVVQLVVPDHNSFRAYVGWTTLNRAGLKFI